MRLAKEGLTFDLRACGADHSGATVPESHRLPHFNPRPYGADPPSVKAATVATALTKGGTGPLSALIRRSLDRESEQGMRCEAFASKSAAAPATVSGEPEPQSHWENPGRR